MYTEQVTQALGFATPIHPQVLNTGILYSGAVDLAKFRRAFWMLDLGAISNGGSITATVQESANNSDWQTAQNAGTITLSALTTASRLYTQEIRADQLSAGYRYVRLKVEETGGQNVSVCCIACGAAANHSPGNLHNAAAVSTQNVAS